MLRPLIEQACKNAPLPCHWLDLRVTFDGQSDYLAPGGALPTALGSEAAAQAIWAVMQANCIAQ